MFPEDSLASGRSGYQQLGQHVPVPDASPPVQMFHCVSCGDLLMAAPSRLPVWDDCGDECCIAPVLVCRSRPSEDEMAARYPEEEEEEEGHG